MTMRLIIFGVCWICMAGFTRASTSSSPSTNSVNDAEMQSQAFAIQTRLPQYNHIPSAESPCFQIRQVVLVQSSHDSNMDDAILPGIPTQWEATFNGSREAISGLQGDDAPTGKCIGSKGIAIVIKRIQDQFVKHGFATTRVLAAEQDLASGVLKLIVIPGRVKEIRFHPEQQNPIGFKTAVPVRSGEILNLRDVEQALENFKRVPTVEADVEIVPAEDAASVGQSDLVISHRQRAPARFSLAADDGGSKSTGKYQGSATLSLDNPLQLSDLFYFTSSHDLGGGNEGSRGTHGYSMHYSVPLRYWMLGTTYSKNSCFQSVDGMYQNYTYSCFSESSEIKLSVVAYRDAVRKTTVSLKALQYKSNNFIDDTEVLVERRVVGAWELGVYHKDTLGRASLDGGFSYKRGSNDFGALAAPEEMFDEGRSKMGVMTMDLHMLEPFTVWNNHFNYNVALRVQDNTTPLTPQDRFVIGGRNVVRGFDGEATLSASRGWTLRNDWGLAVASSGQEVYLGLDAGEVSGQSVQARSGNSLSGGVIGFRGAYKKLQFDFFLGTPLIQPEGFTTAETSAGFSLSLNL